MIEYVKCRGKHSGCVLSIENNKEFYRSDSQAPWIYKDLLFVWTFVLQAPGSEYKHVLVRLRKAPS